jgi:hypothetical protein
VSRTLSAEALPCCVCSVVGPSVDQRRIEQQVTARRGRPLPVEVLIRVLTRPHLRIAAAMIASMRRWWAPCQ